MSHDISEEDAINLVEDRVKFKLYAAEQHLKNLKNLEDNGVTMHSSKGRVDWEMQIEPFLFHLVGVRDSLLARTNDNLKLKLKDRDVKIDKIKILLTYLNEQSLISNLDRLDKNHCFSKLRKWRNQITHINLLNVLFKVEIPETNKPKVFFVDDPEKKIEVIPFLENSLQIVKDLLQQIINSEPRLG